MAITRLTNWVDGQVLTAGDLNAEFNNIINNAVGLISPLTANLNAGFNRITNLRLDGATAYTITTTSNLGRIAYHTVDGVMLLSQKTTGPFLPIGPTINQPTRVSGLIGSMVSNVGSFQALGYTLTTTTGMNFGVSATSSFSIDTQLAGSTQNGRDQAAAFTSTAVHFYVIATGVGSTAPAGLVSTNPPPTGPTLPSSYIGWGYLGSAIYTPASSVVARTVHQVGNRALVTISTANTVLSNVVASTATQADCGGIIPTIAKSMILEVRADVISSAGGLGEVNGTITVETSGGFDLAVLPIYSEDLQDNSVNMYTMTQEVPNLATTPTVWCHGAFIVNQGGFGSSGMTVIARGYVLPNGDV